MKVNSFVVLATVLCAILVMGVSTATAATETVTVDVLFNIGAVDELTVTLLGQSAVTSAVGGTACPANIEFNSTDGNDEWENATVSGGGSTQDHTNPILSLDNTGTTNLKIDMSLGSALDSCQLLRYNTSTPVYNGVGLSVNESENATLDTSFTPAESAISVWLNGNFSACLDADDTSATLTIYAVTV